MNYKDYVKVICPYCLYRNEDKCKIVKGIDGICRCLEYKLDKQKLEEDHEPDYKTWTIKEEQNSIK